MIQLVVLPLSVQLIFLKPLQMVVCERQLQLVV